MIFNALRLCSVVILFPDGRRSYMINLNETIKI